MLTLSGNEKDKYQLWHNESEHKKIIHNEYSQMKRFIILLV